MEAINQLLEQFNIFYNFYSFANLLACVFTLLAGLFLLTLKHKSKSTIALGLAFLLLSPFNLTYFVAHSLYHPIASYHRWFTVLLILPPLIHFCQWCFKYPENSHPRLSRAVLLVQYAVAALCTGAFVYITLNSRQNFIMNGQLWDFDADWFSKIYGIIIFMYLLSILGVGVWKTVITQGRERWTVLGISVAIMVASLVPAILNIAQRDGRVSRSAFVITFVLFTVIGYFFILILYINRTRDRTSFMVKIVGISLVTFLLMMQVISYFTLNDREAEYDKLHVQYAERALEGGQRNEDIQYILRYNLADGAVTPMYEREPWPLKYDEHVPDLLNTAIYAQLRAEDPVGYRDRARLLIESHNEPFFAGYRAALLRLLNNTGAEDDELKSAMLAGLGGIDATVTVGYNKIRVLKDDGFRASLISFLKDSSEEFAPFAEAIGDHVVANPDLDGGELKQSVLSFLAPLKPAQSRYFRKLTDESPQKFLHFTSFTSYDSEQKAVFEVGFSYLNYRRYIHGSAIQQTLILLVALVVLLAVFPYFFQGSLITPLNALVGGVGQVNDGNLETEVPVYVQDEIGFLAQSFNSMVVSIRDAREKLQDYANNLEEKVKERTAELKQTLEEVRALKTQQDGDYFLTSLLQKPLNYNANKSKLVSTDFFLEQKKKFEFRTKKADLGGDICLTGTLRLGKPDNFRRYIIALNGDAMGKSMQGAGGSLVMGVVMNSIMARSAKNNRVLDVTPQQWLTDVYEEIHGVFQAFNGSMVISCVLAAIDEQSGEMWYFNAEHPHTVIYRNGKASFIEEELLLRKIGLESEIPFKVQYFQLQAGDVVIMGSDGRDDLDLTPGQAVRTINEDEFLFLKRVEESDGDVERIIRSIKSYGELTDDLSLLRIGFHESGVRVDRHSENELPDRVVIDIDINDEFEQASRDGIEGAVEQRSEEFEEFFRLGRKLAREGRLDESLDYLNKAYAIRNDVPALNKIMAVLTFKERDYARAVEILGAYLAHDPGIEDFWLYLSISNKRTGDYHQALDAAKRVYSMNPDRVINLINLADIHLKLGDSAQAREYVDRALNIDPQNRQARTLQASLV